MVFALDLASASQSAHRRMVKARARDALDLLFSVHVAQVRHSLRRGPMVMIAMAVIGTLLRRSALYHDCRGSMRKCPTCVLLAVPAWEAGQVPRNLVPWVLLQIQLGIVKVISVLLSSGTRVRSPRPVVMWETRTCFGVRQRVDSASQQRPRSFDDLLAQRRPNR